RLRGVGTTARGDRAAPAAPERRSTLSRSDRTQLAGRDIGNHEAELPRPGPFEALPVLDPDFGVVPDALACLFEKTPLIHLGIPGAAHDAQGDHPRLALIDLRFADVDHVLEDVGHPPQARAVAEDDVLLVPPVDRGDHSARAATSARAAECDDVPHLVSEQWGRGITQVRADHSLTGPVRVRNELDR